MGEALANPVSGTATCALKDDSGLVHAAMARESGAFLVRFPVLAGFLIDHPHG